MKERDVRLGSAPFDTGLNEEGRPPVVMESRHLRRRNNGVVGEDERRRAKNIPGRGLERTGKLETRTTKPDLTGSTHAGKIQGNEKLTESIHRGSSLIPH